MGTISMQNRATERCIMVKLKIRGDSISFSQKKPVKIVNSVNLFPRTWASLSDGEKLLKGRNRAMTRLATNCNSIKSEPDLFVTLMLDRKEHPCRDIEEEKRRFAKFRRLLRWAYPQAWAIENRMG